MNGKVTRRRFVQAAMAGALATGAGDTAVAATATGNEERPVTTEQNAPVSNDTAQLTPKTDIGGPALHFDFPALHIGVAEYAEGPTGCTVFYFPKGALGVVDVRGGSPGTLMAGDGYVDALCYAGGSLYGLEAATGVAAELFAQHRYSAKWMDIALVRGAIIYDYPPRKNTIYPDKALGRAALKAAQTGLFPLGPHGAGCSATVGKGFDYDLGEASGQGGAFRQAGATRVAVFTVVNAMGAIVDRAGQVVRGHFDRKANRRIPIAELLERKVAAQQPAKPASGNTTLTLVVTNQKIAGAALTQLARQVHGSLSRAIQPFHGLEDGDVLYAVTTNEVENPHLSATVLSVMASELAWDAVLTCFAPQR